MVRGAYFLLATLVIILVIPREGRFEFEFSRGNPWMHDDLYAPFDFPIHKSEAELLAERRAILSNVKPFFSFDTTAVALALGRLGADLEAADGNLGLRLPSGFLPVTDEVAASIQALLPIIYRQGIIEADRLRETAHRANASITLLKDRVAYHTPLAELFTPQSALQLLEQELASRFGHQVQADRQGMRELPWQQVILPNVLPEARTQAKVKAELLRNLSSTKGLVHAGERIVDRGEVISQHQYTLLHSLRREYESRLGMVADPRLLLLGHGIMVGVIMLVLYLFLRSFRQEILADSSKVLFILMLITLMVAVSSLVVQHSPISIYLVPFVIVPIFIRAFYDSRLALFIHLVTVFIVGFFVPNSFEFLFLHFIAGIVAIISLTNLYLRGKLFLTVGLVLGTYWVLFIGMVTIQQGSPLAVEPTRLAWFAGNALLLLASYQLIYIFEKLFGFLSDSTLIELSDTNNALMRRLSELAPGTFQHSLQVANLAEAAILHIGGNPLLVRVGALYHDVGKLGRPHYFIENQSPDFNPHHNLDFEESAQIILGHVAEGVQIARKHQLPEQIINFIITHHGTTRVQYFLQLFREKFPNAKEDVVKFEYPGPLPFTREMAVVMMADAVEAATRSLKTVTHQSIEGIVDSVLNHQQADEQYANADITFRDLTIVKQIFKKKLLNIYHARIEYPGLYPEAAAAEEG